jgi:hypothetical protein
MTPEDEYAIGSQLKWTRDGNQSGRVMATAADKPKRR